MCPRTGDPQLVIAQIHRKRADTREWLKEEVDFGGMKLNRLSTLFTNLPMDMKA
jgi:hypothetical protein